MTKNLTIKETKKKGLSLLELPWILFFVAMYFLPAVNKLIPETVGFLLIVTYLVILAFSNEKLQSTVIRLIFFSVWMAFIYFLLTDTVTIADDVALGGVKRIFSKANQVIRMFFPAFLALRVLRKATKKQIAWLFGISCVLMTYVMVITIREIAINPNITRSWHDVGALDAADVNVAHYYFVYAVPVIVSLLVLACFRLKHIGWRTLCLAAIVFCFAFLVEAQYTLALLIALIGCALAVFQGLRNPWAKVATLVVFAFLLVLTGDILNWMSTVVTHEQMSLRLSELAAFFSTGDASGYNLNGRFTLYGETIKAFLHSPIWGNRRLDFDGHATFLTVFADTGILGGIPYMGAIFASKKQIKRLLGEKNVLFTVSFIQFLIMGFTNPIHSAFALGGAIWFVIPLMIYLMKTPTGATGDKQYE